MMFKQNKLVNESNVTYDNIPERRNISAVRNDMYPNRKTMTGSTTLTWLAKRDTRPADRPNTIPISGEPNKIPANDARHATTS